MGMKFTAKNRKRASTLLILERWALEGPTGWSDAIHMHGEIFTHEKNYLRILKELNPKKYKEYLKKKRKSEEDDRKAIEWLNNEERRDLEYYKKLWRKCRVA